MTYIFGIRYLFLRVCFACLSIFMCILAQTKAVMSQNSKWIYLCMHLYTYVYSACDREVVGSSPTRDELFSKTFRFGALFMAHMDIFMHAFIYICILGM